MSSMSRGSYLSQVESDGIDIVTDYLRTIAQYDHLKLTADQEIALAKRIESGDKAAYQLMVNANLQLVPFVAKWYLGRGMELMDLIQEGNIGLLKAIRTYDWRKGCRFSTHGVQWIQQAISRALHDKGRLIRKPSYAISLQTKVRRFCLEYAQEHHQQPSDDLIMAACDIKSLDLLWGVMLPEPVSLEKPAYNSGGSQDGDDELTIGDTIVDDSAIETAEREETAFLCRDVIDGMLAILDEREMKVMRYRYGFVDGESHTLEETGREMRFTRERARQLEHNAIQKIKMQYLRTHPGLRADLGYDAPLPSFITRKKAA